MSALQLISEKYQRKDNSDIALTGSIVKHTCLICGNPVYFLPNHSNRGYSPIEVFPKSQFEEIRDKRLINIASVLGAIKDQPSGYTNAKSDERKKIMQQLIAEVPRHTNNQKLKRDRKRIHPLEEEDLLTISEFSFKKNVRELLEIISK